MSIPVFSSNKTFQNSLSGLLGECVVSLNKSEESEAFWKPLLVRVPAFLSPVFRTGSPVFWTENPVFRTGSPVFWTESPVFRTFLSAYKNCEFQCLHL